MVALIGLAVVSAALVHCAGTWAYAFFIILLDGQIAFHEPNRLISIAELGLAVALTLAGILFLIIAILGLKRNKLIQGSRVCPNCGVKLVHNVEPSRRGFGTRVRQLWQCSFAAARLGISPCGSRVGMVHI